MVLKEEQEKLKRLLSDAIPLLCKNALAFKNEFSIEALIGITIDKDQVVLVNINDMVHADTSSLEPDSQLDDSNEAEIKTEKPNNSRRKRKNPGRHLQGIQHIMPQMEEEDVDPYVDSHSGELHIVEENVKRQKVSPMTTIKQEPGRLEIVEGSDDPDLDTFLNSSQADDSTADYPTSLRSLPSTSSTAQTPVTTLPDSVLQHDQASPLQQPVPSPSDLFQSGDRMPQDFMVKISATSRACTICQKVYSGSSACTSTLDHICAEHLKIYRHVCENCSKGFKWSTRLAAHRRKCQAS